MASAPPKVTDRWHKKDGTPSAEYGMGLRWRVRYRDPAGIQVGKFFATKAEAQAYANKITSDMHQGTYTDPKAGQMSLREYAENWLGSMTNPYGTNYQVTSRVRKHIIGPLGDKALLSLEASAIRAWAAGRLKAGVSPNYLHLIHGHMVTILDAAVEDNKIPRNNALSKSVRLPRKTKSLLVPWTSQQVGDVLAALPPRYAIMATIGAMCGLRQGEIFGLRVHDVDFLRSNVHVCRQVAKPRSQLYFDLPKYDKERDVPLPPSVAQVLAAYLATYPPVAVTLPWREPSGKPVTETLIVTSREGKALNRNYINKFIWKPALDAAGIESEGPVGRANGMHALRHFFASWVLEEGTTIGQLAEWLGHTDTAFTQKTYVHLMPDSGERAKGAADRVHGKILGDPAVDARSQGTGTEP